MIGYVTVGTNDLERAARFFDAVLALLGATRSYTTDRQVAWEIEPDGPKLCVTIPHDRDRATIGNGVMIALAAADAETVDAVHARALALGARDEGPPGPRGTRGFYAGYFRDLDGNKLNVFVADRLTG